MKPDVTIDSVSMSSMGWLRETVNLPTPQSQTDTVVVPGRNTPIRFSEALGRVSYQPRTFEITLSMLGSRERFNQMVSEAVNRFAGHLASVVFSEEPDFYAIGTLQAAPSYDPISRKGQLLLSCSDGDSYRYRTEKTVVQISGSGTVKLTNDYMPVIPSVTTTAETALSWQIGTDTFRKSVSTGTWEFPELELQYGDNTVAVSGNGTTTFRYREGPPMSLFRIYVDDALFYHPNLSKLAITEAKVSEDAENVDSLTLSAPHNHPYLSSVKPMASTILCKKNDEIVFEGRALDDGSDFYNTHTWTCESCLAYLKDTIQPPFSYKGSLKGLLEYFLGVHNAAVESKKQFQLGNITVKDDNDYIAYSNSEYSVTMDAIKSKLLDTHGGYLQVRYDGGMKYLDYLADFNMTSLQTVEFGKNLLDVKITHDHTERATALIPLGANITETDEEGNEVETNKRVDITSVNDGKNYVCDEAAVSEIGWIWTSEVWEDVTLPENLLRKAKARMAELSKGITSMELTIIDESDTGADIGDIRARMYVKCLSKPHGIDGTHLCVSRTRDYLNPSGNTITIGASGITLTSAAAKQGQNISALEDDLLGQTAKISSAVDSIANAKDDISALQINVQECYSEITKTSEQITSAVREEYISKSEIETIQQDFQTSITQNSTEIRMDFQSSLDVISGQISANQNLLEEYIRFKGALIELGKVGNAFTAELSNEQLAFLENGQTIAYISNQSLVITNAEIRYKLSLGAEGRGWFDFIPRASGNLSVVWRNTSS